VSPPYPESKTPIETVFFIHSNLQKKGNQMNDYPFKNFNSIIV
jgi:hypothetical protein